MSDKSAQQIHDLVEDTVTKAAAVVDQARSVIDDTLTDAKSAIRDLDDNDALTAVRVVAAESVDNVTSAYRRSPGRVIALGTLAVSAVALLGLLLSKRR
jgi:predicted metal-dependent peptidase